MVFHQRLFMKLQDPPPWAASCTLPLHGRVSPVQPTGCALIASSQEQSEWVTYHPKPSMLQPWLPTPIEDRLLAAVSSCSNHVLRPVFPPLIERRTGLRPRPHNFTLPDKDDTNFFPRVLYRVLAHSPSHNGLTSVLS